MELNSPSRVCRLSLIAQLSNAGSVAATVEGDYLAHGLRRHCGLCLVLPLRSVALGQFLNLSSILGQIILCCEGCLAVSLASTHYMSANPPTRHTHQLWQLNMFDFVKGPLGRWAQSPSAENHYFRGSQLLCWEDTEAALWRGPQCGELRPVLPGCVSRLRSGSSGLSQAFRWLWLWQHLHRSLMRDCEPETPR